MTVPTFSVDIPCSAEGVCQVNERVVEFLESHGIDPHTVSTVRLLVEEAAVNVVRHGLSDDGPHRIHLALEVQPERVILRLTDDGREYDPRATPMPDFEKPFEERPIGGLGVHLIRTLAERMDYQRIGDTNVLTLHVPRGPKDSSRD